MSFWQRGKDEIERKNEELDYYTTQFDVAVRIITSTIDQLTDAITGIDQTIEEITDYQDRLESTKSGLQSAKEKNQRVIQNFQALLK